MARRKRERQKVIRGRAPSDARPKTRSILPSKLSERSFGARDRALHALWDIRRGSSIDQAARDNGVTRRTIKKYVGTALVQDRPGGRLRATHGGQQIALFPITHGGQQIALFPIGSFGSPSTKIGTPKGLLLPIRATYSISANRDTPN
jgi:hypothetical protein